jgi:hypothetical protein
MILRHQSLVFVMISIVLAACAPALDRPTATPTPTVCQPSLAQPSKNDFPEIQATMKSAGEIWALLFFDKAYASQEEKIVWRITGTGQKFDIYAQHPDGTIIHPIWGPEYHGGSNWERPGVEWGTGFNFPKPGCWTLTATLGATTGEIRLEVMAANP